MGAGASAGEPDPAMIGGWSAYRRSDRAGSYDRLDLFFVCPAFRRCLFTVRAAISFARRGLFPRFAADSLMCSY